LKLQKGTVVTVTVWANAFVLVLLCVQLPLYILAVADFRARIQYYADVIFPIWYAVLGSATMLNLLGLWKVTILKRKRQSWKFNNLDNHNTKAKLDSIVQRIQTTSLILVILLAILTCLVTFVSGHFSDRTILSDPRCNVDLLSFSTKLADTLAMIGFIDCIWFILPSLLPLKSGNVSLSSIRTRTLKTQSLSRSASQGAASHPPSWEVVPE
jgi:hypothetical protein